MTLFTRRSVVAGIGALGMTAAAIGRSAATTIDPTALKPGGYFFEPDLSPEGPVTIIVSLPDQLVHVYRNGVKIGISTCSSGKQGHRTPTGVFVILQKDRHHHSSTYNNAPMPNMQRLTWSGIALHAGELPGYPASHGCVRLPKKFSELIFGITRLGIPVIIADETSEPEEIVHPGILLPAAAEAEASAAVLKAAKRYDLSPTNIASGVISGSDRKVVLLIDGKVAWESPIEIADPGEMLGEHVFSLLGPTDHGGSFKWLTYDFAGKREILGSESPVLSRISVAKQEEAHAILTDAVRGSTLVVTDLPASATTRTAPGFVVIDAEVDVG